MCVPLRVRVCLFALGSPRVTVDEYASYICATSILRFGILHETYSPLVCHHPSCKFLINAYVRDRQSRLALFQSVSCRCFQEHLRFFLRSITTRMHLESSEFAIARARSLCTFRFRDKSPSCFCFYLHDTLLSTIDSDQINDTAVLPSLDV